MAKEQVYQSIILKKQTFGEGDEIITLFTKELGKVRALAKSTKYAKSKLQYGLQTLFFSHISLARGRGMPRIIGTEVQNTFAGIRNNLAAAKLAFYALELVLKFTPDEQQNTALFELLYSFLNFLSQPEFSTHELEIGLAKFKIDFLQAQGLGVDVPEEVENVEHVGFSNSRGGFLVNEDAVDYVPVDRQTLEQFLALGKLPFGDTADAKVLLSDVSQLQHILSAFLTYQLERDIKSEHLLEI